LKTDWYETAKPGTYVAIPAGAGLGSVTLPEEILNILDIARAAHYATNEDSQTMAKGFDFLGIDDCLKRSGDCILRS
jgi:hypothetical protein